MRIQEHGDLHFPASRSVAGSSTRHIQQCRFSSVAASPVVWKVDCDDCASLWLKTTVCESSEVCERARLGDRGREDCEGASVCCCDDRSVGRRRSVSLDAMVCVVRMC